MPVEIHALACERHAFHPEAQLLLGGRTPSQLDFPAGAENALPGKLTGNRCFQKACDGSVIARVSRGGSYLTVACDLSARDGPDGFRKCMIPDFGGSRGHHGLALESAFDLDLRGIALDFDLRAKGL